MKMRPFWVLLHRYAGLTMTAFLIVVGLTGSLLAFYTELERFVNPELYAEANGRAPLAPDALITSAERLAPEARVESIWLNDEAVNVGVLPRQHPANGEAYALDFDQLILNPYTGEEMGRRRWGDIAQGKINLMPFIYKLHFALALDEAGGWILGITALIWTLDCFVGFYLTLPATLRQSPATVAGPRSFRQRWQPAWTVKWRASAYRINFDLHRAGGLWLWAALLVFAWSSVYMNLGDTVYKKVMQSVSEYHEPWTEFADLDTPLEHPRLSLRDAYLTADRLLARAAEKHGIRVQAPGGFWLNRQKGFYVYSVRSSADFQDHHGLTRIVIDADTGEEKLFLLPRGQYSGNTITAWLLALHTANVFGLPYRIFVCVLGLAIVMLSVTGVVIWLRKRRARQERRLPRQGGATVTPGARTQKPLGM